MRNYGHRAIIPLLCSAVLLAGCAQKVVFRIGRPLVGTIVNLTIVAESEEKAAKASQAVFDEIARIERLLSPYDEKSDISRVNRNAAAKEVIVSAETFGLIERSVKTSDATGGAFDITFASIAHLWNYRDPNFRPPSDAVLRGALPLLNYRHIVLDEKKRSVRFANPRTKIGLGAIAKGYLVGRSIALLRSMGVTDAIVEAGGDLQVSGSRDGSPWTVGLIHPRTRNIIASIALESGEAIVTSGDYERFVIYSGKRYHHIIDPKTGHPAEGMASVTVLCPDPEEADALATSFFVMGKERTVRFLAGRPDVRVVLIDPEMKVSASKSLRGRVTFLEETAVDWF